MDSPALEESFGSCTIIKTQRLALSLEPLLLPHAVIPLPNPGHWPLPYLPAQPQLSGQAATFAARSWRAFLRADSAVASPPRHRFSSLEHLCQLLLGPVLTQDYWPMGSLCLWPELQPHSPETPLSFSIPREETHEATREVTQSVGPSGHLPAHSFQGQSAPTPLGLCCSSSRHSIRLVQVMQSDSEVSGPTAETLQPVHSQPRKYSPWHCHLSRMKCCGITTYFSMAPTSPNPRTSLRSHHLSCKRWFCRPSCRWLNMASRPNLIPINISVETAVLCSRLKV